MTLRSAREQGSSLRAANCEGLHSRSQYHCLVVLLLAGGCAQMACAGPVGETVATSLAQPILRGVRAWGGINETTGTEPFLQAFINGQIVSYVNSCHVLLPDGEPDCDLIEGDCADSAEACNYIYMIESLVAAGAIMAILLAAAFISCCIVSSCASRHYNSSWDVSSAGLDGHGGSGGLVARTQKASFYLVPAAAAMLAVATMLGFIIVLELGTDVLKLVDGVKTGTHVPG